MQDLRRVTKITVPQPKNSRDQKKGERQEVRGHRPHQQPNTESKEQDKRKGRSRMHEV